MDPTHAPPPPSPPRPLPPLTPPSPSSPLPPSVPLALEGGGQGERRKKGGEGKWGKGVSGFHPALPFPRPALPHPWASIVFTARPAQRLEKTIRAA
jgi:hypothetical protein